MRIVLAQQATQPIYEQIKEQLKVSILSGLLEENTQLPSIRQLARDLQVSVITTTRAYNDLELEGYIQTTPGKGCYVKKMDRSRIQEQYLNTATTTLQEGIRLAALAGLSSVQIHQLLDDLLKGATP